MYAHTEKKRERYSQRARKRSKIETFSVYLLPPELGVKIVSHSDRQWETTTASTTALGFHKIKKGNLAISLVFSQFLQPVIFFSKKCNFLLFVRNSIINDNEKKFMEFGRTTLNDNSKKQQDAAEISSVASQLTEASRREEQKNTI